jgi:endonuclease-3
LKDVDRIVAILKRETARFREPIVTTFAREKDPFKVLVSCLLSLRTKDEVTARAAERLFAAAGDAEALSRLAPARIEELIHPVGFYRTKARRLRQLAGVLVRERGGRVPETIAELLELEGVGRKTANLVVVLGYGKPGICVDTHVHRICNRLGWVETGTPEKTEFALRERLPRRHWAVINDLLVAWGQNICRPLSPWCSRCALAGHCPRVGVERSR